MRHSGAGTTGRFRPLPALPIQSGTDFRSCVIVTVTPVSRPPAPAASGSTRRVGRPLWLAFLAGCAVGTLGGLIGLGGAEFRLPLLIGLFGFVALQAIIVNKAMSLIVVVAAIPARLLAVPFAALIDEWTVVVNLLVGSLIGAWLGATWATRMRASTLYRVLALLLLGIAVVFAAENADAIPAWALPPFVQACAGILAGFGIGVVAAIMGVAGGELLIPTIVLLYGVDIKLAGSLSLLVSLPTMLVAFFRYSRDQAFTVLGQHPSFIVAMGGGSLAGTFLGALLLGVVSEELLIPLIVALLVISAVKVWRHSNPAPGA